MRIAVSPTIALKLAVGLSIAVAAFGCVSSGANTTVSRTPRSWTGAGNTLVTGGFRVVGIESDKLRISPTFDQSYTVGDPPLRDAALYQSGSGRIGTVLRSEGSGATNLDLIYVPHPSGYVGGPDGPVVRIRPVHEVGFVLARENRQIRRICGLAMAPTAEGDTLFMVVIACRPDANVCQAALVQVALNLWPPGGGAQPVAEPSWSVEPSSISPIGQDSAFERTVCPLVTSTGPGDRGRTSYIAVLSPGLGRAAVRMYRSDRVAQGPLSTMQVGRDNHQATDIAIVRGHETWFYLAVLWKAPGTAIVDSYLASFEDGPLTEPVRAGTASHSAPSDTLFIEAIATMENPVELFLFGATEVQRIDFTF